MGKFHFFHKVDKKKTNSIVKTNGVMATTVTFGTTDIANRDKLIDDDSIAQVEAKGMI